jgi:hypothetical protein
MLRAYNVMLEEVRRGRQWEKSTDELFEINKLKEEKSGY